MNETPKHAQNGQQATYALYTREGDFVADVQPPSFSEPPDVIVFGTRTFVRRKYSDPRIKPSYYEAFAWVAPVQGGTKPR